jgi:hypothetical protein
MRFAVNKGGFIENVIVAEEEQKAELEAGLGAVLEDASVYGLQIGDLWVDGKGWTRNRDGEQYTLEPLNPEEWSQYQALAQQVEEQETMLAELEEALNG